MAHSNRCKSILQPIHDGNQIFHSTITHLDCSRFNRSGLCWKCLGLKLILFYTQKGKWWWSHNLAQYLVSYIHFAIVWFSFHFATITVSTVLLLAISLIRLQLVQVEWLQCCRPMNVRTITLIVESLFVGSLCTCYGSSGSFLRGQTTYLRVTNDLIR